jgi:predicted neutral ceramidase superfamily lipid hydrolase
VVIVRVISKGSLDEYMSSTVKHYSSLFTLPSLSKVILGIAVLCMVGGVAVALPLFSSYRTLATGLLFGAMLFSIVVLSDLIISQSFMKADPIFDLRRCSALSFFSWMIWLAFMSLGATASFFVKGHNVWVKFFFSGLCPVLTLRLLVFSTVSLADYEEIFASSVIQPASCVISFLLIAPLLGYAISVPSLFFLLSATVIAVAVVFLFTSLLDRTGRATVGIGSLSLFKAFLVNWIIDADKPLEGFFEKLGVDENIEVSLLGFRTEKKMKAIMVIPACHRGPFKNVGSSLLPYLIQAALGKQARCVVVVPHGLVGHERDLASQFQNRLMVKSILDSVESFSSLGLQAKTFTRVQKNGAKASCQAFGDCAVFTLTLAPETTEDLPQRLNSMISEESDKAGLHHTMVINAHNSLEGASKSDESIASLKAAAAASLEKSLQRKQFPFEIGAATVTPEEFSVRDGMGPGGISVITVKVADQIAAYITIDGNNMVSGLRERIISQLVDLGVVDGEVLTTDTHAVNGIVQIARGYHPIGEAMDQTKLIRWVEHAVKEALGNMEPAEALWTSTVVPNVKVIGEKQITQLCLLAERTLERAKKLAALLFSSAGILLAVLFLSL